jgi:hypothetical protein
MDHMSKFRFADSVSMRLVQIFQEALLFGVDGADLLRQVRLVQAESDPHTLVLDPDYAQHVKEGHSRAEEEAKKLSESKRPKLILGGDGSDNN